MPDIIVALLRHMDHQPLQGLLGPYGMPVGRISRWRLECRSGSEQMLTSDLQTYPISEEALRKQVYELEKKHAATPCKRESLACAVRS